MRTDSSANQSSTSNAKPFEISSDIAPSTNLNSVNQAHNNTLTNNVKSSVIYSISDDTEKICNPKEKGTQISSLVKSSDELLNTVMHIDENYNNDHSHNHSQNNMSKVNSQNNYAGNENDTNNHFMGVKRTFEAHLDKKSASEEDSISNKVNEITKSLEESIFHNAEDEMSEDNEVISDSDLAEALTQVLDEVSQEEKYFSNSDMSVDEELMRETVAEIHEEMSSGLIIDNIVLTPPIHFRDF